MHLVGVDIGYTERRRSNGIAVVRDGKLIRAERLSVNERRGTGQRLREHGRQAAEQLLVAQSFRRSLQPLHRVWPDAPIVEAFPNAFLGVVVPDDDYVSATKIKRGGKFDWLYERWIHRGLFRSVVTAAQLPAEIAARCEAEPDHDVRAALVCLLTAAFAANGTAVAVGQHVDGYFFLPPAHLWAEWATESIGTHRV